LKEKSIWSQLFLWSPNIDTAVAATSEVLIIVLAFLGLKIFENTWLNHLLFGFLGTVVVCVILPLYWIVMVKKGNLNILGITAKFWVISLIVSILLGGLSFFAYYRNYKINAAILPALILGIYGLWEVFFVYGWLQLRFEEAFGIIPGIILSSACFSLYHIGYGWYNFYLLAGLFIMAGIFAVIFRFTKNILILWPFYWPIAGLHGFARAGVTANWQGAGYSAIFLLLMLISIFIFYRIQIKKQSS